ncbi:MAG: hypothetical protein RDU76_04275 [Candidatus Edwardsbacteria bacterium]|nr:hypothetical protein [Candidatus Edwardsbacteria bacterium]
MFDNKEKLMQKVASLPKGSLSPSRRYWCLTCKMLFSIDHPVCPYMPKMCINTPIPIEVMPLESSLCLEKLGLFYPKIPQKIMSFLVVGDFGQSGDGLFNAYLGFLNDWGVKYRNEKLQTIKSFIIMVSGCETAQRVTAEEVTFIITDLGKIWDKDKLFALLNPVISLFKDVLSISQTINLDELEVTGDAPSGKYHCPMCRKFFEFSTQRANITCPLMAQKCMAAPADIAQAKYRLEDLAKVYQYTPDIYKKLISAFPQNPAAGKYLEKLLTDEWHFDPDEFALGRIKSALGLDESR